MVETEKPCPKCGKMFKRISTHLPFCAGGGSTSPAITPPPPAEIPTEFPDASKVLQTYETEKKIADEKIKVTESKGGGEIHGFSFLLLTLKDWINSFWDKPPYIQLTESTANRLEVQFNKAFGIYVSPIVGFLISIFIIFGIPILIHVIGKDMVYGLIKKFKDGIAKRKEEKSKNVKN